MRCELLTRRDPASDIVDFDVDRFGNVAIIREIAGKRSAIVRGDEWLSWGEAKLPRLSRIRWLSTDQVVLWSFPFGHQPGRVCTLTKDSTPAPISIGVPRNVVGGDGLFYVTYSDERFLGADDNDPEAQLIATFDIGGQMIFGLRDKLEDRAASVDAEGEPNDPLEAKAGHVTDRNEGLFTIYACAGLWILDPTRKTVENIELPLPSHRVSALSSFEDRIRFSESGASGIDFGEVNRGSGGTADLGSLQLEALGGNPVAGEREKRGVAIRGAPGGCFVFRYDGALWQVTPG